MTPTTPWHQAALSLARWAGHTVGKLTDEEVETALAKAATLFTEEQMEFLVSMGVSHIDVENGCLTQACKEHLTEGPCGWGYTHLRGSVGSYNQIRLTADRWDPSVEVFGPGGQLTVRMTRDGYIAYCRDDRRPRDLARAVAAVAAINPTALERADQEAGDEVESEELAEFNIYSALCDSPGHILAGVREEVKSA